MEEEKETPPKVKKEAPPKVAIVTGANKGIGFGIVRNLCKQFDGIVYLTARDVERGKKAVEELNQLGLKPEFHQLDIDDGCSITEFANFIKDTHGGIDVLVNNAAIAYKKDATEPFGEQAEVTLRVNFFDLINVCSALFPLLRPHARVVNLSSSSGFLQRIPGDRLKEKLGDPELPRRNLIRLMNEFVIDAKAGTHANTGWPDSAYVVSKVAVSALTRIQHREFLKDPREDIVINHVHPGYVNTDMTSHQGPLTIEEGADAPTYLALLPPLSESPKGDYIWFNREIVDWVNGPVPSTKE
ncbi:carbonyl reductase [NADPH] 3 [Halyomorpha halys]|uniref:carbonyl reductase [NADPH] 3 n=1 Tax=Halyomorpha halys TaxID=286706 RepID=UPI0006D50E1B|nr:carbonyl reductase [NADPH] 3-like [Halyomorpha halys]